MADPESADKVWDLWNAGDITDGLAAWAWCTLAASAQQRNGVVSASNEQEKARDLAINASLTTLQFQLSLGGFDEDTEAPAKAVDDEFLLGYVYGNCDCHLQWLGVTDELLGVECITSVCLRMFGHEYGPKINGRMLAFAQRMQSFPNFLEGVVLGGTEANEMVSAIANQEAEGQPVKTGLAKYLRGEL